jgi:hypothetical protein
MEIILDYPLAPIPYPLAWASFLYERYPVPMSNAPSIPMSVIAIASEGPVFAIVDAPSTLSGEVDAP